jgi:hypothetical protein
MTNVVLAIIPPTCTALDLAGCDLITDKGLGVLNHSVQRLNLAFCTQITTKGLKELVHVKWLNLNGCHQFNETTATYLPRSMVTPAGVRLLDK